MGSDTVRCCTYNKEHDEIRRREGGGQEMCVWGWEEGRRARGRERVRIWEDLRVRAFRGLRSSSCSPVICFSNYLMATDSSVVLLVKIERPSVD